MSGKKRKKLHGSFTPHDFVGPGTIPLDPTFGSFTLLEPVSHEVNHGFFGESV
jgi:hypothetical protein